MTSIKRRLARSKFPCNGGSREKASRKNPRGLFYNLLQRQCVLGIRVCILICLNFCEFFKNW